DMTARICGICPVSYMMTSIEAIEDAFGITVSQQTRDLRRLLALSQCNLQVDQNSHLRRT
ncbi:hypothetical protein HKBW3S42_01400, partial [Candidatus Hakubella thermalkaliphila]